MAALCKLAGVPQNSKVPIRATNSGSTTTTTMVVLPWYIACAGPSSCDNQINIIHSVEGHGGKHVRQTPNNPRLANPGGLEI